MNNRLALSILNRKKPRNVLEKGFTLVELMIVIVIVGILSSVALPNFLATRTKAEAGSLIGSMAAFSKLCGVNAVMGDTSALNQPATMQLTAVGGGTNCSTGATIANANAWTAGTIVGVRCGANAAGTAQVAVAASTTCTFTIDTTGTVTGSW